MPDSFWVDDVGFLFDDDGIIVCDECPCDSEGEDCCFDDPVPSTLLYTGAGWANGGCTGCTGLNTSFELPLIGACQWGFDSNGSGAPLFCGFGPPAPGLRAAFNLTITTISPTECRVRLVITAIGFLGGAGEFIYQATLAPATALPWTLDFVSGVGCGSIPATVQIDEA